MTSQIHQFSEFPKMARLSREVIITEKIDGTNAQIAIIPLENRADFPAHSLGVFDIEGSLFYMAAGSRSRWITPQDDNYGFAGWCHRNFEQLTLLGPGRHFGEWWGGGIQRGYGLEKMHKRLSLFNTSRYCMYGDTPKAISVTPIATHWQRVLPPCVGLVPELYRGEFTTDVCVAALAELRFSGSRAAPGFMKPEGIVAYHTAAGIGFKKTLEKDESPKSLNK